MHKRAYKLHMELEWDEAKASANLLKHGVAFADAIGVLEDPEALTVQDDSDDEERFVTLGFDLLGRLLVVVYTWRGEVVRLISARRASARERRAYSKGQE